MDLLQRGWELDPTVLVDAGRALPPWAGWLCAAFGLGYAAFGAHHHALRATAGALAGLVGFLAADKVLDAATFGLSRELLSWMAACALGILGAVWPVAAAFVIAGLAGARLFAPLIPLEDPLLRAMPAALVSAMLCGIFVRAIAALASSFVGAVVAAVGISALLLHGGHADWLAPHPVVSLLPFSLIFVSGAAFQLTRRPPAPKKDRGQQGGTREPEVQLSGGGAA